MVIKERAGMLIIVLLLTVIGQPVVAAQSDLKLKVGISPFSPFVMVSGEKPAGVSIDTWQILAQELSIEYEFVKYKGVTDKLQGLKNGKIDIAIGGITITDQGLKNGKIDIAIGGITITEAREELFDFTHPIHHTGLDILIPKTARTTFLGLVSSLFKGNKIVLFGGLLILIVISGHIIWIVERSSKKTATSFHRKYFPGVFEGMYGKVMVVGKLFERQDYGLALPQGSPLREKFNRAILLLVESDKLEQIRTKWFGK